MVPSKAAVGGGIAPANGRKGDARSDQHVVQRRGLRRINEYSSHYDPAIREKLKAGEITASDLNRNTETKHMYPTKNIFMTLGDASDGKTTISRGVVEKGEFLHNPLIGLIDADEKPGLVKYSDSIRQMDVRNFDDFTAIEILLRNFKCLLLDMPGTAKVFIKNAVSDPAGLADLGILIVPILLVGARGTSVEEAEWWLQQMKDLPLCYIVHNPKKEVNEIQIQNFNKKFANGKLPGPAKRIIIHLPPLEASIAKELERKGVPLANIIEGKILSVESELLSLSSTRNRVAKWRNAFFAALQPLVDAIHAALKDDKPTEK